MPPIPATPGTPRDPIYDVLFVLYKLLDATRAKTPASISVTSQLPDELLEALSRPLPTPSISIPPIPPYPVPPSAEAIATAIALTLPKTREAEIIKLLDTLSKKINALAYGGGGGSSDLVTLRDSEDSSRRLRIDTDGVITTKSPDLEVRLDYAGRSDTNPVYVGRAAPATPSSSPWSVQRLEYDANSRLTRVQVLSGPWDSRTTLNWS
jgi:hypothetical protein